MGKYFSTLTFTWIFAACSNTRIPDPDVAIDHTSPSDTVIDHTTPIDTMDIVAQDTSTDTPTDNTTDVTTTDVTTTDQFVTDGPVQCTANGVPTGEECV